MITTLVTSQNCGKNKITGTKFTLFFPPISCMHIRVILKVTLSLGLPLGLLLPSHAEFWETKEETDYLVMIL
jgi:hypothetical protein